MRKIQFDRVQIISAELSTLSFEENKIRTNRLKAWLDDLDIIYSEGVGVYKCSIETCFVIKPRDIGEAVCIEEIAFRQFEQECTLWQDKTGEAYLYYPDRKPEHLGKLRETPKLLAQKQDSYTLLNGKYYAIGA